MKSKLLGILLLTLVISGCGTNIMYFTQNTSGKDLQIEIITDCPVYPEQDSFCAENRMVHPSEIKGWFKKPTNYFSKRIPIDEISMANCKFTAPDSSTILIQSHCLYQDSAKIIIQEKDTIYFYTVNNEQFWKAPEHISVQKNRVRFYDCYVIDLKKDLP
jgi:hypothetical protein